MGDKEKALERERARLRNVQNPSVTNQKRKKRLRSVNAKYWKIKKTKAKREGRVFEREVPEAPEKEPEIEEIEEGPEDRLVSDEDLDELYTYDEEIEEEE
ncbi:MAG: hypothetical protein GF309_14420 [Candidatus Lokiarchaeota archaeon]|nr:hypothetical protein [Candidatus Lokiarchaeota archaeon]